MLEMASFDDRNLDILMPVLFSARLHLSPNEFLTDTILQRHSRSIQDFAPPTTIVIGLEKNKPGRAFFPLYQNVYV